MIKKRRIIFVQLPLINHSYDYIHGNIEYASAAIAGFIIKNVTRNVDIHNLPAVLTQFGSNSIIVKYITHYEPDIVAFTCFLWNIERSLYIAQLIKEQNSSIQIIFGGSEIYPGSISLTEQRDFIDYFAVGEGEWFFKKLLSENNIPEYETFVNGNHVIVQPADELIPTEMICEPLRGKRLYPMSDGSAFFELTRGCPYKCSYCLYSKNFNVIREIPFEILLQILTDEQFKRDLKEIYILSPALNNTKNFSQKIEQLSRINHGIRLHSEMRAGGIDEKIACSLYKAGFRSMEVGLQTTNIESLDRVGRNTKPEKEIEGMRHLKNAGIDLKIGLIPGLPGDSRDSFLQMTDKLIHFGFKDNIELYPLMILPGTLIRDNANKCGIRYLKKPPYYYNSGWGISFDDIRYISRYIEDATGFSHIVKKMPDFSKHEQGLYCRGICINSDDLLNWDSNKYRDCIETNVFDFYIRVSNEQIPYQGLSELVKNLPEHQLFNIVMYTNSIVEEKKIIDLLKNNDQDNLLRRINIFHEWEDGVTIRLYQVLNKFENYCKAKKSYSFMTPIFHINQKNYHDFSLIDDYDDNVLIAKGMYITIKRDIRKFVDSIESVAFEDASEQEEFYRMMGYEYIQFPYKFKIITV